MLSTPFSLHQKYPENFLSSRWLQIENSNIQMVDKPKKIQNFFEHIIFIIKQNLKVITCYKNSLLTISRHFIKKCDTLDLTSFTHEQLSNIITNVKAVNNKIKKHNENILIPFLANPTLDQQILKLQNRYNETNLNHTLQNTMFFPKPDEFKTLDPKFLAQQWERNNELLLGCIALNKNSSLGFSGQRPDGLNKLLDTRKTSSNSFENYIWVAGYNYPLDPITYLADLTLLAKTAYCYASSGSKYGGIFFVNTQGETAYSEKIGLNGGLAGLLDDKGVSINSEAAEKFIKLTARKKTSALPEYKKFPKKGDVSTSKIPTTNEMVLSFDAISYSKRIYGVMTSDQLIYSNSFISALHNIYKEAAEEVGPISAIPDLHRVYFAERFNYQQIILHALEKMGNFVDFTPQLIEKYRAKGAELMKDFDAVTKVDVQKLQKLAGEHWHRDESFYAYV